MALVVPALVASVITAYLLGMLVENYLARSWQQQGTADPLALHRRRYGSSL
jgi:hypothetical protein